MGFFSTAGAGIVKTLVDCFIGPVARRVKYLTHTKSKIKKLKENVDNLAATKERLQHAINDAIRKGESVHADVELWKTSLDDIIEKANKCLEDEGNANTKKSLFGFCPNLIRRYKLGRESTKLRDDFVKLDPEKKFPSISYSVPPQDVCNTSNVENTMSGSRILTLKEIMEDLRSPDTEIILVCGIGGVGKTTLAQDILRKAIEDKLFDDVVMIRDVKENPDLGIIQKEIARKLGMEVHENQTMYGRAPFLSDRIKDKKTLVILDDVWEALDLVAMGIPRTVTCKILMTCRSRKILSVDFREQKVFPLGILGEEDAWSLFEKMAGNIVKEDHHIRDTAIQVAKRCGGLPILLFTVASSLKYRTTVPPWKDTLRRLKDIANEELTKKAYLALEWSYNQLDEQELKPFFLLCGTNLVQNTVHLSDLLKYGMGLGLFKKVETIEEAQNALSSLVEKLKDFGLLLDDNDDLCVRMHDFVRDVALSIASRDSHALSVASGDVLKEWPTSDVLAKYRYISLDYCHTPSLPEVLKCPELEMFYLGRSTDVRREFPCNFFKDVIKLKVLDLTDVSLTPALPLSLQLLKNLRTLCLDFCELGNISIVGELESLEILSFQRSKVKCLPSEIGKLTHLRLLDLTGCVDLEVISPNVISNLKMLEDLRMKDSFRKWEDERVVGERRNACLSELKHLPHLTALQIHIPDANSLPADMFSNKRLQRYQIFVGDSVVWRYMDHVTSTLNMLILKLSISSTLKSGLQMLLEKSAVLCLDGTAGTRPQQTHLHIINSKVQLRNLTTLKVDRCDDKFLLSSSTARSLIQLEHLRISGCQLLEGVVSRKKNDEENSRDIMFPKLKHVELSDLPNLARFCSGNNSESPVLTEHSVMCNEIVVVDSVGNHSLEDNVGASLFDEKVRLPWLKKLKIDGLPKLMTIWHDQLPQDFNFQNLNSVEIRNCRSLRSVFPASIVVRGLQQLEKLAVQNCKEMEEIIAKKERFESTTPEFVFPKVTSMVFSELQEVRNFYQGMHVLKVPLLKHLAMINIKAEENHESTLLNLSLFLIQKDSFPNLENLELSGGKIWSDVAAAPELFSKLKSICFCGWSPFSDLDAGVLSLLDKLPNLETVEERAVIVDNRNGSGNREIHAIHVPLPRVTTLKLSFMDKLGNVGGNHNSRPAADLVLPNLKNLVVHSCSRLRSLDSSAISLRNIIGLQVSSCKKLKYLTTSEVAKSLLQLTTLIVRDCEVMTEIIRVSSNPDDDGDNEDAFEIPFKRLQHLELTKLPRLEGFCLGSNFVVEFPSLKTSYISKRLTEMKIVHHHVETL